MATATTKWLQQQHLLAARFSSFISCRSKATTNSEEISARYIASRDGDDESYCIAWQYKLAAATTFVGSNLLVLHIVSPESNDERRGGNEREHPISSHIASHDGDDDLLCASTQRCPMATTNHIVSRGNTNWLRQHHLLSASPSCIHNVLRKSNDKERGIASHTGQ